MVDDAEFMRAYVERADPGAFRTLFDRYAGRLHRYFLRTTRDARSAEDLVQQTFLHLHRARRDFDLSRPLRPWVFTIAANLLRERARRRRRRPEVLVDPADLARGAHPPDVSTATDRLVRRCLDALPDAQREVIVLHWFEGFSMREVAGIVGAGLSAVKVRAHRGYAGLRRCVGGPL